MDQPAVPRALPAEIYTDPALHARARSQILLRGWHYVCHGSNIPETGDYYAFELMGEDLFVIRGRDGEMRAFYNVCQHRGHTLVAATGRTRVLVCPYHAWAYELDGRLRAAPGTRQVEGFDRSAICLTPLRTEVFLGFLFVNFDADARPMAELFAGVETAVRALCPTIEARRFAHEHSAPEHCSWLVAVENYNECYHCGHVHKAFADGVIDPASYDIQPMPGIRALRHSARPATGEARWYDTGGSDYGAFYLYPCFSLQIYPGGVVNTYYWRPEGPRDTTVHRGWFSADGVVDDQLQAVIDLDRDTTFAEDLALVKAVQRGLGSRGYRPGPLVVARSCSGIDSEHSIAALHRWVMEDLG
ncbi:aromatic ring-hydroxylating dioxygenase subunit alpha [Paralimibaculum aggregatum]|uniref:Aromatic ring-hydroxylating dioxygenase subunit alpha n=1 Tax=Paralimibaculum aggregatum TaxID=3036245 RepID=A0ABQ6LFB2_9RHOB|nr:aromatic ring-hydroxylating dioxygenase subunit alpha [Limibaculum sp. NKW23]GMG82024.1 aromatic ring-hydroxylating dioxygenase subunit alpha [Limibaculum sp. NKW23]